MRLNSGGVIEQAARNSAVRFQRVERRQIQWRPLSLDQLLPEDHTARLVWAYVESLDLSELYEKIQAHEHGPGRNPIDPKILLALWLLATIDGVGSARRLARLDENHLVYFLMDVVGAMDLSPFYERYRNSVGGQPPFHPQMMVTLLLYAYCKGVFSSRKIQSRCQEDVAFRVIVSDDVPDFRTISDFRKDNLVHM